MKDLAYDNALRLETLRTEAEQYRQQKLLKPQKASAQAPTLFIRLKLILT